MNSKRIRLGLWFIQITCSSAFRDELEGDLFEIYERNCSKKSRNVGQWLFLWNAFTSFRFYRIHKFKNSNSTNMFSNYLLVTIRHSRRHKIFSFVNIFSLVIGLFTCFCIALFIKGEMSYDNFHEKGNDLYRLVVHDEKNETLSAKMSTHLSKLLRQSFPQVAVCSFGNDDIRIEHKGQSIISEGFYWTDSTFFDVFSFKLINGDRNALKDKNRILISESLSERLYGHTNVVGELLPLKIYDGDITLNMVIGGVVQDPPSNSHIQFEILGPMPKAQEIYKDLVELQGFYWLSSYALIHKTTLPLIQESHAAEFNKRRPENSNSQSLYFQPLSKAYLYSADINGWTSLGSITNVRLFAAIGALILLISIFNYINLSTTRLLTRKKEVGLRKSIGAQPLSIVQQIMTESIIYCLLSAIIALGLLYVLTPQLNTLISLNLNMKSVGLLDLAFVGGAVLAIALSSGLYPAFVLAKTRTGNQPDKYETPKGSLDTSKILLFFQYIATILLIACSLIVYTQYKYMRNYNLGVRTDNLVNLAVNDKAVQQKIPALKNSLLAIEGISAITATGETFPGRMQNTWNYSWPGMGEKGQVIDIVGVDKEYFDVLNIQFVSGSNFTREYVQDSAKSVILNRAAKELTEKNDLVGSKVTIGGSNREVIGVVENYHMQSLHHQIQPTAYFVAPTGARISPDNLLIRLNTEELSKTIRAIENTWGDFSSEPLAFSFVDDDLARQYTSESRFMYTLQIFTGIAILVALTGLFGLITFQTRQRLKDISIRKALVAEYNHLLLYLSSGFLKLYLLASLFGLPMAFYFGLNWLQEYPIRISLDVGIFIAALSIGLIASLTVVISQVRRAIRINPANVLKE